MLTSALWVGGEIFLGFSLTMFVGALIAIFGDQITMGSRRQSGLVAAPRSLPNAGAFQLPSLDPSQLSRSRRAPLVRAESTLAPRLGRAVISRKAA